MKETYSGTGLMHTAGHANQRPCSANDFVRTVFTENSVAAGHVPN